MNSKGLNIRYFTLSYFTLLHIEKIQYYAWQRTKTANIPLYMPCQANLASHEFIDCTLFDLILMSIRYCGNVISQFNQNKGRIILLLRLQLSPLYANAVNVTMLKIPKNRK